MTPRTALTCLAAFLLVEYSSQSCYTYHFRCASGFTCITERCPPANTTLTVDGEVTARLAHRDMQEGPVFLVCGDQDCDALHLRGVAEDGRLVTTAVTGCNWESLECRRPDNWRQQVQQPEWPSGAKHFPTGELVFRVGRNATTFSVWREGHPEHKAHAPASSSAMVLAVRPHWWTTDMDVVWSS